MTVQSEYLVEIRNLKKHFPLYRGVFGGKSGKVLAVDGVSFGIREGEAFGLVGESGSGKTTVGRTIIRAHEPTEGEILFRTREGEVLDFAAFSRKELRPYRAHMQMIFQDPFSSLSPRMTVRDIIAEPLMVLNTMRTEAIDERVREVALLCGLNVEHLRRYPHAFSGGQRQRIGIARALVLNPEFIVCDEPVSALDVSIQAQILNLLKDLQEQLHLTYLFIAHDLSVVEHFCDRVAVMYLGRLAEMATTYDLFYHPIHPYTEALMSAIPVADPDTVMNPMILQGEIPDPTNPPSGCAFHPRCRYAKAICKEQRPEWLEHTPGHFAACHFAGQLPLRGIKEFQEEVWVRAPENGPANASAADN
ncbi:MAG: ABC transporter ATP-binding protein [Chloroflexi bacterium]|nr:ABC transporter ATP-binding protein [Chloroflexota bacterium]